MNIVISDHAKKRIEERNISESLVYTALLQPDKVEKDKTVSNRFVAKKIYLAEANRRYLLLIIYKLEYKQIKVITVISTSKISKYI